MTFAEEMSRQPDALAGMLSFYGNEGAEPLERARAAVARGPVLLLGMGSSHFAGLYGAMLLNQGGNPAVAIEASGAITDAPALLREAAAWVLISQSGESPEVLRLAAWEGRPRTVIAITNQETSPLARESDMALPLVAGAEEATTSGTYTNTLALLALLAGRPPGDVDPLPTSMRRILGTRYDFSGLTSDVVTVVGRGLSLTSAHQTALILREGAHLTASAYSGGAFRHGPLQWAGPGAQFLVFMGAEPSRSLQEALATDLRRRGADVFDVGSGPEDTWQLPQCPAELAPILEILPAQLLMVNAAERRNLVPGELTVKVTRQE
jgi:glucosamine--fructose-6-phosphate aminotransferase (isomerizing)